ncbi:hypothetical protein Mapa_015237 [Marchantia paleacea]|nr:hypothetical protein Mapa_015237 [Marchantia paleacea]
MDDIWSMKFPWRLMQERCGCILYHIIFRDAKITFEYKLGLHNTKGQEAGDGRIRALSSPDFFEDPENFNPGWFKKSVLASVYFTIGGGHTLCPNPEFSKVPTMALIHHFLKRVWSAQTRKSFLISFPRARKLCQ